MIKLVRKLSSQNLGSSRSQTPEPPASGKAPASESLQVPASKLRSSQSAYSLRRPIDNPETPAAKTPTHPEMEAPPSRLDVAANWAKVLVTHPILFKKAMDQDACLPSGLPRLTDKVHRHPVGPNTYDGLGQSDQSRLSPKYPVLYSIGRPKDGGKDVLLSATWGPGLLSPADRQAPGRLDYTRIPNMTLSLRDADPSKYVPMSRGTKGGMPFDPETGMPQLPRGFDKADKYNIEMKPWQPSQGGSAARSASKPIGSATPLAARQPESTVQERSLTPEPSGHPEPYERPRAPTPSRMGSFPTIRVEDAD